MSDSLVRYGPSVIGATATSLITCGGVGTYVIVRHLHIVNTSASASWFTFGINGVSAAQALWFQEPLLVDDFLDWTGNMPLFGSSTTPDSLQMIAQTAGVLTVTIGAVAGP